MQSIHILGAPIEAFQAAHVSLFAYHHTPAQAAEARRRTRMYFMCVVK